jgi:nucleotide-binding universal stress UspA family protein
MTGARTVFGADDILAKHNGHPAEMILKIANAQRADLIVLGVRRADARIGVATHVTRPIAHKIVSHARCPVLTVRA